jgi:hypothetical protein
MKPLLHFSAPFLAMGYLLSAAPANGHPGHGPIEVPPVHYLVSPDHLGMALVAGVILFCILRAARTPRDRPSRPS